MFCMPYRAAWAIDRSEAAAKKRQSSRRGSESEMQYWRYCCCCCCVIHYVKYCAHPDAPAVRGGCGHLLRSSWNGL